MKRVRNMASKKSFATILSIAAVSLLPWQARYIFGAHTLQGDPYEYGIYSVYAVSVIAVIAAVSVLLYKRPKLDKRLVYLFAIVVTSMLISAAVSRVQALALFGVSVFLVAGSYFIIARFLCRKTLVIALGISAIVQTCFAWVQFIVQKIPANTYLGVADHDPSVLGQSVVVIDGDRFLRAYGTLPHPNVLGGFLAIVCIILFVRFLTAQQEQKKSGVNEAFAYAAAALFIFSGVLLSFSRAALLVIAVFFVVLIGYALIRKHRTILHRLSVITAILIIGTVLFNAATDNVLANRFGVLLQDRKQIRLEQLSLDGRALGYAQAIHTVTPQSVWFGIGMGNYVSAIEEKIPWLPLYSYQPVHNALLLSLVEIGIIGFGALLFFEIKLIIPIIRHTRDWERFLRLAPFIMLGFLSLFDHFLWSGFFGFALWWLMLGFTTKKIQAREDAGLKQ